MWNATKEIEEIEYVKMAHTVTGPYDIVVYAELPEANDLRELTKQVHAIEGVKSTETCIAM